MCQRTGWRVHAFVLMSNHCHFPLETPEANLVRGMTRLQTTYTTRDNARHRTSGHLFGGRYSRAERDRQRPALPEGLPRGWSSTRSWGAAPLGDAAGLFAPESGAGGPRATRRAGLLDYRWSSLRGYVVKRERARWMTVERGFAALDRADTVADRRALPEDLERRMREEAAERCGSAAPNSYGWLHLRHALYPMEDG